MADRRKLQGEIDKCLKKVTEGVDSFEDTWKKLHVSSNSNQKDKYETDLKKEIKKLQRMRDQIKTWLTSADIKDKKALQESKKLIETQMERFKVVEKETKIKAYSKEGLGSIQKIDPAQKEKEDVTSWITCSVDKLNIKIDLCESQMEKLNVGVKKKKMDKEKLERHKKLEDVKTKHKYHVEQLETLLRSLDNGTVTASVIRQIEDDVDHYIDNSDDPDFQGNDYMYEDLNLESFDDYLAKQTSGHPCANDVNNGTADEENSLVFTNSSVSTASNSRSQTPLSENPSSEDGKGFSTSSIPRLPTTSTISGTSSESISPALSQANLQTDLTVINSQASSTLYATAVASLPNNHLQTTTNPGSVAWNPADRSQDGETKPFLPNSSALHAANHISCSSSPPSSADPLSSGGTMLPEALANPSFQHNNPPLDQLSDLSFSKSRLHALTELNKQGLPPVIRQNEETTRSFPATQSFGASSMSVIPNDAQFSLESFNKERNLLNNNRLSNNAQNFSLSGMQNAGFQASHNLAYTKTTEDIYSALSGVALTAAPSPTSTKIDLETVFGKLPEIREEEKRTLEILGAMQKRLPLEYESFKPKYLRPGGPAETPDYYPSYTPKHNTIDFFKQLSNETLFFIFYYLEGTKAQYFAAKALKTKSWRFHTLLLMWFQRHEQPRNVTDDFEEGTYKYFDFEKWREEKKEGFTFEYKYLEDKDLS